MNCKNLDELLSDVIQVAKEAVIADDEVVKRLAVGDIIDALASVVPAERVADGRACRSATAVNRTKIRSLNGLTTVIAKADVCGRKFYAEAEYDADNEERYDDNIGYVANVYEDRGNEGPVDLARIEFDSFCGSNAVMQMLRGVLHGAAIHYGHRRRNRANKRARLEKQEGK